MTPTYPWSWYSDPAVLAVERERIFRPAWHYAGHVGQLPEPGSYAALLTGGLPVVLTRDRDDETRAFLNVCLHRGAEVAEGSGCRETLQCPYHAWTYGLDGRLRSAPRSGELDLGGVTLTPLRLETWGPFLFVCADPETPFALDGLTLPFDPAELAFHSRSHYVLEANWKIAVENYLECYHCPVAHPGFTALVDVDPGAYRLEANGGVWSQRGNARDGTGECVFHLVWPALKINVYPGFRNLSIGPVWPESPHRTAGFLDYFFGPEVSAEDAADLVAFDDQVGAEDTSLVESVQRGVGAGLVENGLLMPESESLIADFQRNVREILTSDDGPSSGGVATFLDA